MGLLTPAEFASVRRALDVSLDEVLLPDGVIADPLYLDAAERWVLAVVPAAESLTGMDRARAVRAAVLYCAALIAPAVPSITAQNLEGSGGYTRKAMDWAARAAELRALAGVELAPLAPSMAALRPTMFAVASGARGR